MTRPMIPPSVNLAHNVTFPIPPIAGLQDIWPIRRRFRVTSAVRAEPRGSRRGLAAGMTSANNHIKDFVEYHESNSLPIQKVEKILPSISSEVVSPVISPRKRSALCDPPKSILHSHGL
jgi:hypothetical protein